MSEIHLPLNPRPREDPYASGIVQSNLEDFIQLFQKGLEDGDLLIWDKLLGRYLAKSAGGVETVTALPLTDLYPGRLIILTDSLSSPTYLWNLRYNADSISTYKWECIGGSPALMIVSPWQSTFSTSPTNLSTPGPTLVLPAGVGGDFVLDYGAQGRSGAFGSESRMAYAINGVAPDVTLNSAVTTLNDFQSMSVRRKATAVAAGATIQSKYATSNPSFEASFRERWLSVIPFRVG